MPERHRKQCKRYDNPGDAHCLTFSCLGRRPLLADPHLAAMFCQVLGEARKKEPFSLWAYVIMPEHIHIVLQPHGGSTISRILRFIKRPMTDRAILWARQHDATLLDQLRCDHDDGRVSHHVWLPGGGYDRNLRSPREVHEKIDYVHGNPLRRRLVSRPEDWPWSSYRAWQMGTNEPISIDRDAVPMLRE